MSTHGLPDTGASAASAQAWREVYVWFEAPRDAAEAVQAAFKRLLSAMPRHDMRPHSGPPRLLRRCPDSVRDGVPHDTWMEIWPAVAAPRLADWLAELATHAQGCGLGALGAARHTEIFTPLP